MFLYKEDFNKFAAALQETIDYVKTDLMPDFDFDSFSHEDDGEYYAQQHNNYAPAETTASTQEPAESVYLPVDEDFAVAETAPDYVETPALQEAPAAQHSDVEIDSWKA